MRIYLLVAVLLGATNLASAADSLWPVQQQLARKKFVDLTHAFAPGIPRWPGFPDETRKTVYWYENTRTRWEPDFSRKYLRM